MRRTKVKEILQREAAGGEVLVQGWVKTRRSSGAVSFIQMSDGSTLRDLQVVVEQAPAGLSLGRGAQHRLPAISVVGEVVESQGKGQKYEVKAQRIELLGSADPETYALQKKRHTLEFLRENGHLRPRTNTFGAMPACEAPPPLPSIASSRAGVFSTYIPPRSPPATPKGRDPCFG